MDSDMSAILKKSFSNFRQKKISHTIIFKEKCSTQSLNFSFIKLYLVSKTCLRNLENSGAWKYCKWPCIFLVHSNIPAKKYLKIMKFSSSSQAVSLINVQIKALMHSLMRSSSSFVSDLLRDSIAIYFEISVNISTLVLKSIFQFLSTILWMVLRSLKMMCITRLFKEMLTRPNNSISSF